MARFLIFSLLTLFGVFALQAQTPKPLSDYERIMQEASTELQKNNFSKSISLTDEAEKLSPNDKRTHNFRGAAYTKQRDFPKAVESFTKALAVDPQYFGAAFNLGEIEFLQKHYPECRTRFQKLLVTAQATPKEETHKLPFGMATVDLLKYKIYLSYLLENNDSEAKTQLARFDWAGETPAYYYANAAWEFQHQNPTKGLEWIQSSASIFNLPLNELFADSCFELGWIKRQAPPQ